jgi:C1A family cysteine protease
MVGSNVMMFKGCRFDPYDGRDWGFKATSDDPLPKAVDNRKHISSIKNQGAEGSCVGFAVAKGIETVLGKAAGRFKNLSERWAYEKAKIYDEWPGNNYEGSSVRGGLKAAHKEGVCLEQFWRYIPNQKGRPTPKAKTSAAEHKVLSYERVKGIDNIKRAIYENEIVVGASLIHEGWFSPRRNGVIPLRSNFRVLGGHAFALVGYGGRGFWVANSWGNRWGVKGFGVLLFNDAKLHLVDAWTIKMASRDEPEPEPKPAVCEKCGRPL